MGCYAPHRTFDGGKTSDGKTIIVWRRTESLRGKTLYLPCGKCIGCRLRYASTWAMRCIHEASLYEENSFITLTYSDKDMPMDGGLSMDDWQEFMKRLRQKNGKGIRFIMAGEYGTKYLRPHYHAILFNCGFADKYYWKKSGENKLYRSEGLEKLWNKGYCTIGNVTYESAGYVARYCMEKMNSAHIDAVEKLGTRQEFLNMSRRPGIGDGWIRKYYREVYKDDYILIDGIKIKPPRFYDNKIKEWKPELYERIKQKRLELGPKLSIQRDKNGRKILVDENDSFRLAVKEKVKLLKIKVLKKPYRSES